MESREKLGIKVLPQHKRALEAIAQADGEPVSVVMRRLIRAEAERRGLWPAPQPASPKQEARHA
jgi:DNA-binding FadR family transcriptional regulator